MTRAVLVACLVTAVVAAGGAAVGTDFAAKIDPRVAADTAAGREAHVMVVLNGQANVAGATAGASSRTAQGERAVSALRRAAAAQSGVRAMLRERGVPFRAFWVVNALVVTGDRRLVEALARRGDVAAIEPDRAFAGVAADTLETAVATTAAPRGVEWNVQRIGAPALWAKGFTGQGLVYANADTGVHWDAPALKRQYRGWDGTTANHAYSWWDAVHGDIDGNGTNACGFSLRAPCDDDASSSSHGTHTMGTAVGDDGAGNQIGVAPGARWISCRNMDEGVGRPSTYIECLQFFLAPTDLDGQNPDPSKRPNAIGNSYSCPPEEGCSVGALQAAVDNVRAAGIFMAVAAGNDGDRGCGTVTDPPAVYDSAVSVGATDAADQIAFFSSRGPVQADGSGRMKPDLAAPGVGIRSVTASGFGFLSGTSMAAPHVSGAVVLLWSALPELVGNVDATEKLLQDTALHRTTTNGCGGDTATAVPNNTYGSGRIDLAAAYAVASGSAKGALSIADRSVSEGNAGRRAVRFSVTLATAAAKPVSVSYATRARTARSGSDFVAAAGTLAFAAGEQTRTVAVQVLGDRQVERDETFAVVLSAPRNAMLQRATAVGTIRNDDTDGTAPTLSGLAVTPSPVTSGRRATLRFRLTELATVTCALERSAPSGWRSVRRLRSQFTAGPSTLSFGTHGLAAGRYRMACVPADGAGNVGRRAVAPFSVL